MLCLSGVQVADAELYVGERSEWTGQEGRELNLGEGVEGDREFMTGFGERFALSDGRVNAFEEGAELAFEGVEVDAAVQEPL